MEVQFIFDTERNHYQWMNVGWQQLNRIYRCIVHFDIKDGKILLQQNLTDQNPADELIEMEVPREDIVLGWQPPFKGQYTEYGAALIYSRLLPKYDHLKKKKLGKDLTFPK